jgi:putative regulator of septum formation
MSGRDTAWRSGKRTLRTRLVMAGAFLGALAVLSASMLFSWPVSVTTEETAAAEAAAAAFDSPSGTCLDWPHDNPRNMRRVSCDKPHTFEVSRIVEIGGDYGPKAPPPNNDGWQQVVTEKCTQVANEYLGGPLDPYGKYTVGALKPTSEQWRSGDRKLRCGLQRVTPSGDRLLPTTGKAQATTQSNVHDPGTCFGLVDGEPGDPIDCSRGHSYEVVGQVDLHAAFGDAYPDEAAQGEKLAELCPPVAAQYTGNKDLKAMQLALYWDTLKPESWAAKSYLVNCKVGAQAENGALDAVRGSIKAQPVSTTPPTSGK